MVDEIIPRLAANDSRPSSFSMVFRTVRAYFWILIFVEGNVVVSFMIAAPEHMAATALDISGIGSTIEAASVAVAPATTAVPPPAADEVSAEVSALFSAQGQNYQLISKYASQAHQDFVQKFFNAAESYALAEAKNGSPLQTLTSLATNNPATKVLGHSPLPGLGSKISPTVNLLKGVLSNPLGALAQRFPFLNQIIQNQIGYWKTLITALESGKPLNLVKAFNQVINQFEDNTYHVIKELSDFSQSFSKAGGLHIGAPLALLLDAMGAPILTVQSLQTSAQTFIHALQSGNILGAFGTLVKAPFNAAHAFLYGQGTLPYTYHKTVDFHIGGHEINRTLNIPLNIPIGGLFAPLQPLSANINFDAPKLPIHIHKTIPIPGTQTGGLLAGLEAEAQQLAHIITPIPLITPPTQHPHLGWL